MPELQDHHLTSQISDNVMTRGLGGRHAESTQSTQLTHGSAAPANRNQAVYGSLSSFSLYNLPFYIAVLTPLSRSECL
jgi:hypothetical protein